MPSIERIKAAGCLLAAGWGTLATEIAFPRLVVANYGSSAIVWSIVISVTMAALALGYYVASAIERSRAVAVSGYSLAAASVIAAGTPIGVKLLTSVLPAYSMINMALITTATVGISCTALGLSGMLMAGVWDQRNEGHYRGSGVGAGYAISTCGSILGALTTTFYAIPTLGIKAPFYLAAATLIAASACLGTRKLLLAVASIAICSFVAIGQHNSQSTYTVASAESVYQQIDITNHGDGIYAMLLNNDLSARQRISTKSPIGAFSTFAVKFCRDKGSHNVLILGGAGNTVALGLEQLGVSTTTVEIDPAVQRMSNHWFGRPAGATIISDARSFLMQEQQQYDCIIMDVFSGHHIIPSHLLTVEAMQEMKRCLSEEGALLVNAIATPHGVVHQNICATITAVFGRTETYMISTGNSLSTPTALAVATGPQLAGMTVFPQVPQGVPSTDDKNTIEFHMLKASHEHLLSQALLAAAKRERR